MTVTLRPGDGRVVCHDEHVWGTVVSFDVRDPDGDLPDDGAVSAALADGVGCLHWVDEVFSTFRPDSLVSRLRDGRVAEAALRADDPDQRALREVLARCRFARAQTQGAFDPWAAPGGFDPSGLVKGWAAARVADSLVRDGIRNVQVNAGGDVVTRGQAAPGEPWRIGVRHPDDPDAVLAVVEVADGVVATSGTYERGEHIIDARTGGPASGARAATVVGPDAALADALATALLVSGPDGLRQLGRWPGWSGLVVVDDTVTSVGPAF